MFELTQRLLAAAEGGEPLVSVTVLEPGPRPIAAGSRFAVSKSGERMGSLGDSTIEDLVAAYAPDAFPRHATETVYIAESGISQRSIAGATSLYLEVVESRPVFLIVGGGHIGRCLAKLADFLDYYVAVLDDREDFADAEKIPEADEIICDDFEAAIDRFPINSNTSIVMVTRGHKQDEQSLRRSLGRGAGYLGMIGSRRRTTAVLEHLAEEGYDPAELARIRTPIGLDIAAETPEEIAISIMAEVIALRHNARGGTMYYRRDASLAQR